MQTAPAWFDRTRSVRAAWSIGASVISIMEVLVLADPAADRRDQGDARAGFDERVVGRVLGIDGDHHARGQRVELGVLEGEGRAEVADGRRQGQLDLDLRLAGPLPGDGEEPDRHRGLVCLACQRSRSSGVFRFSASSGVGISISTTRSGWAYTRALMPR